MSGSPRGALPPNPPTRALRPWTPSRTSGPAPGPLFFAPPKKRGEKKGGPTLRSPLAAGEGFPALLEARPRPELAAFASLTLLKQAGRVRWDACLRHAGRSSALLGGAEGVEQPNTEQPAIRLLPAVNGSRFGCWLLAVARRLRRRGAQTRGPCAAGALRDLTRAACLSGGSEASAASSARGPLVEHHREPAWPQAERASAAGPPFFSPLFFGGAKKRGSSAGAKLLLGARGQSPRVQGRRSCSGSRGEAPWAGVWGRKPPRAAT